jgi:hypothetical protein
MHRVKTLDPSTPAARDLERGRFVIRRMDAADMASIAIPWMTEAGWNPGLHDAETFLTADPDGFVVGLLDGEPIATARDVAGLRDGAHVHGTRARDRPRPRLRRHVVRAGLNVRSGTGPPSPDVVTDDPRRVDHPPCRRLAVRR